MFKKYIAGLVTLSLATQAFAAKMTTSQAFYYFASKGNVPALQKLRASGYSVDSSDSSGNSALCEAIYRQDYSAFSLLKQMGASTQHTCINRIPSQTVDQFNQGYVRWAEGVNSGSTPYAGATASQTTSARAGAATASKSVVASESGLSTGAWVGIGVGAAALIGGGIALAAGGGGGGGGHSSAAAVCSGHGSKNSEGECVCNRGYSGENCDACASGYGKYGTSTCYQTLNCENGGTQEGNKCSCREGWTGSTCASRNNNNNTIAVNNEDDRDVYGLKGSSSTVYGACTSSEEAAPVSQINVQNTGNGDVYGIYGSLYVGGAYVNQNDSTAKNTLLLTNKGDGDVYGMYGREIHGTNTSSIYAINTDSGRTNVSVTNEIVLDNSGDGNVYGMYSDDSSITENYGACTGSGTKLQAMNTIRIKNAGDGNVWGMRGSETGSLSYVSGSYSENGSENNTSNVIHVTNIGKGNVYGMTGGKKMSVEYFYGARTGAGDKNTAENTITLNNTGDGDVYGMTSEADEDFYGAWTNSGSENIATNKIIITNHGNGNVYGMRAKQGGTDDFYGARSAAGNTATNTLKLVNIGKGTTYGMYGGKITSSSGEEASNTIDIVSVGGTAVGMYGGGTITNASGDTIAINAIGANYTKEYLKEGTPWTDAVAVFDEDSTVAVGIYADINASVTNAGDIVIKREAFTDDNGTAEDTSDDITYNPKERGGTAYGIYVVGGNTSSKTIENSGTITISGIDNAYGIFVANGNRVTVKNTGTITIEGESKTNDSTADGKFIVLGGGTLVNLGTLSMSSLDLDSMDGSVVAGSGSSFVSDEISGTLKIATDTVSENFNTTYVNKNMIQAEDTSKLSLVAESALFDAKLAGNGTDVVMTMKNFSDVVANKSLAQFLTDNYAHANNEAFYHKLKSFADTKALNHTLNQLTGKEMLSRFNFEDITMMRELNFDMNKHLFNNKESSFSMGGMVASPLAFRGDTGSKSRYSLSSKSDGIWSLGLGVAFTDIRSEDTHKDNTRSDSMYQMIVPIGYKAGGFKFVSSPRLGYARGTYDRTGIDNISYDGKLEKRIFGLMNEARYPIISGDWKLEPTVELNALGYEQKGWETKKEYSLNIPKQRTYSVESGVGFYLTHEKELAKGKELKLTAGVMAYHEFADPYKIDVQMNGMNGAFTLKDEKRSDNRAVGRVGFDLNEDDYAVYGSLVCYMDEEVRSKANLGVKWHF